MRIETFVFKFETQEEFNKFWENNCKDNKNMLACGIGDYMKANDDLSEIISDLYDIANVTQDKKGVLEKAEKILGI